jgi:hypothetical protein
VKFVTPWLARQSWNALNPAADAPGAVAVVPVLAVVAVVVDEAELEPPQPAATIASEAAATAPA